MVIHLDACNRRDSKSKLDEIKSYNNYLREQVQKAHQGRFSRGERNRIENLLYKSECDIVYLKLNCKYYELEEKKGSVNQYSLSVRKKMNLFFEDSENKLSRNQATDLKKKNDNNRF